MAADRNAKVHPPATSFTPEIAEWTNVLLYTRYLLWGAGETAKKREDLSFRLKSPEKRQKKLVHPTRFELMTFYSGGRRSIQLSYGCNRVVLLIYPAFIYFSSKKAQFV